MKVLNYRPINKGSLKGGFDLTLVLDKTAEGSEMTVHDCKLFEKNGQRWVGFPSRSYQSKEGETKYAPYVSVGKELKSKIESECLSQMDSLVIVAAPVEQAIDADKQTIDTDIPF